MITQYLIICPLIFTAGFIDAIAGGGGLISLPAYLLAGLPVHQAIGTNKMSSAMGTTTATIKFAANGFIHWKSAIPCVIFAAAGSYIGSNLSMMVSEKIFSIFMLCALPVIAFYVLKTKKLDNVSETVYTFRTYAICGAAAFTVGMYDGFYGPGTGTFLILALTGLARISLNQAAGTTKIINLTTNLMALTVFLLHKQVVIPLGLTAGLFSIAGNYIGASFFTKKGTKFVRPVIFTVLALLAVKIITQMM